MSEAARSMNPDELDADAAAADAERFLGEFRRNMARQGLIVEKAAKQAGWEPGLTLNISADEASDTVSHRSLCTRASTACLTRRARRTRRKE
jgi:hypothetical protein